jgi:hypothetical protein
VSADWQHPAAGVFTLVVRGPHGTSGSVAVPTDSRRVTVHVDRRLAWNGRAAKAFGARLGEDGYVRLEGLSAGSHTVAVRPAD